MTKATRKASAQRKDGRRLKLNFDAVQRLQKIEFYSKHGSKPVWFELDAPQKEHAFSWTAVPQGLSLMFLYYACWDVADESSFVFPSGDDPEEGRLAMSVANDRNRSGGMIQTLFVERLKNTVARHAPKIFKNIPQPKSNKPRAVMIKTEFLPPDCVEIYQDWKLLAPDAIRAFVPRFRRSLGFDVEEEAIVEEIGGESQRALHQLPSLPNGFFGREEEVENYERKLCRQGAFGLTIFGMAGVGKTAFAVVLGHLLQPRYPDAQIFLNLHGAGANQVGQYHNIERKALTPVEAMQRIIHVFHPDAKLPDNADDLAPIYRSALGAEIEVNGMKVKQRVLIILDNAADSTQVAALLPPSNCLIIVTSRQQLVDLHGLEAFPITCLKPEGAANALKELAPRIQTHADEAAELCGYLPLALTTFAGILKRKSIFSVVDLVDRLRKRREKLDAVDAAFELSYEVLSDELGKCWALLSVFPSTFDARAVEAVWTQHLLSQSPPTGHTQNQANTTTDKSSAESAETSESPFLDAMQALVNASLVDFNLNDYRFRLHDLVRQFCRNKLSEKEYDEAMFSYVEHYRSVGDRADKAFGHGGDGMLQGLQLFDSERTNIEWAFDWLASRIDERSAPLLIWLANSVTYVGQGMRFHPKQRIAWLEKQRDAARLSKNLNVEGAALGNLATAYDSLGETRKAIQIYMEAGKKMADVGNVDAITAIMSNLGVAFLKVGETEKGIALLVKFLEIARERGDKLGQGRATTNLGMAYSELNETHRAMACHAEALIIACEIGDRQGEGNALLNLSICYRDLGKFEQAIDLLNRAMTIHDELGDQAAIGVALTNLGTTYDNLGEFRKATDFYERALAIAREFCDPRLEGNALFNSALSLWHQGKRSEAIVRMQKTEQVYETIGDPKIRKVREQLSEWRRKG